MIGLVFIAIGYYVWFATSVFILHIIYSYIRRKPLGLQSVHDPIVLDCVRLAILLDVIIFTEFNIGLWYGQIGYVSLQVMLVFADNSFTLLCGMMQVLTIIKAVMIYQRGWLANFLDKHVIRISRTFDICYAVLRFLLDLTSTPSPVHIATFMTGRPMAR